jgi:Domain of unknown function (DUF1707)
MPVVAGPGDEMAAGAAGRSRMRASHADREQTIEVLKAAFVQARLSQPELDTRVGQALTARTYADLATLTADIPPAPAAARPERPPAPARRRPLARAAVAAGICLLIAAAAIAAMWVASIADPGGPDPSWAGGLMVVLAVSGIWTAIGIMGCAALTSLDQRSSRRQLPPRPGPGDQALEAEQRGGTGHGPVPPGPRTDQTRADLRTHSSRPHRSRSSGRGARAPRGIRPVPDAM